MKGPYERLKYDLRRVWECPECHHRERSDGTVTFLFCRCQRKNQRAQQVAMRLIDDGPRRVFENVHHGTKRGADQQERSSTSSKGSPAEAKAHSDSTTGGQSDTKRPAKTSSSKPSSAKAPSAKSSRRQKDRKPSHSNADSDQTAGDQTLGMLTPADETADQQPRDQQPQDQQPQDPQPSDKSTDAQPTDGGDAGPSAGG